MRLHVIVPALTAVALTATASPALAQDLGEPTHYEYHHDATRTYIEVQFGSHAPPSDRPSAFRCTYVRQDDGGVTTFLLGAEVRAYPFVDGSAQVVRPAAVSITCSIRLPNGQTMQLSGASVGPVLVQRNRYVTMATTGPVTLCVRPSSVLWSDNVHQTSFREWCETA